MPISSINIVTLKQVIQKTGRYELDDCTLDTPFSVINDQLPVIS